MLASVQVACAVKRNYCMSVRTFKVEVIRGNVQTRLSKIETEKLRWCYLGKPVFNGWADDQITQAFKADEMRDSAVGQGALAIECRADDNGNVWKMKVPINDEVTRYAVEGERSFLRQLNRWLLAPMGYMALINKGSIDFKGYWIASLDGKTVYEGEILAQ